MELTYDLWHLAFANLMERRAPPNIEVQSEVRLSLEPQRADLLLLRRTGVAPQDDQAGVLRTLWPWLARVTVLEFKSPVDGSFRAGDLMRLFGYGVLYDTAHLKELPGRSDLTLALVLPTITRPLRAEIARMGWTLTPLGGGYGRIDGAEYAIYVAATDEVSEAEKDEYLALFSRHRARLGEATQWLQTWMRDKKMKQPNIEELPDYEQMFQKLAEAMPIEKRLAGIPPEQRLAGIRPEQRLAGLDRDHQALALPVEVLRLLPDDYISSLSPEVQDEILERLRLASH